ncbi:hypothetical protein AVEN_60156-1 [Araneus ventricosus]|uniref:Uncharacterized protein n=1 Tax=Araneus ventricosus TaxID=182803 RepID=A0A4Y2W3N9_ARAVE|nr:hypothetical protein AVEN_60156-1 [Araneus ventricosus]
MGAVRPFRILAFKEIHNVVRHCSAVPMGGGPPFTNSPYSYNGCRSICSIGTLMYRNQLQGRGETSRGLAELRHMPTLEVILRQSEEMKITWCGILVVGRLFQ